MSLRPTSEWTDEELVDYFYIHSRTDLHLFSRAMVERMVELSGLVVDLPRDSFLAISASVADGLIEAYRDRLRRRRPRDEHPDYELPHAPGDVATWNVREALEMGMAMRPGRLALMEILSTLDRMIGFAWDQASQELPLPLLLAAAEDARWASLSDSNKLREIVGNGRCCSTLADGETAFLLDLARRLDRDRRGSQELERADEIRAVREDERAACAEIAMSIDCKTVRDARDTFCGTARETGEIVANLILKRGGG
jgi:hypothetical protein